MRIRFLQQYRLCMPGHVAEMDGPIAELLIGRGIAEPVAFPDVAAMELEAATIQPAEAAVRGRPRKRKARKKQAVK